MASAWAQNLSLNTGSDHMGGVFDIDAASSIDFSASGEGGANQFANTRVQGGGTAMVSGDVNLSGAGLTVSGANTHLLVSGGTVSGEGPLTTAAGTLLTLDDGTLHSTGAITLNGAFDWLGGTLAGPGTLTTAGATRLNEGEISTHTLNNRTWNNTGVITWQRGDLRLADAAAVLNNQSGGVLRVALTQTATVSGSGALHNLTGATVDVTAGSNACTVQSDFTNSGTLALAATFNLQRDFTNHGLITLTSAGRLVASAAGEAPSPSLANGSDGTITGTGTIDVTGGAFGNDGVIRPGTLTAPIGTLTVRGNYRQSASGTLGVDLGGTAAGAYDVLAVSGRATLDGTLQVALTQGFVPGAGAQFDVVRYATTTGDFAQTVQPNGQVLTALIGLASYQLQIAAGNNTDPLLQPANTVLVFTDPGSLANQLVGLPGNDTADLVTFTRRPAPGACK